jgi:biopolymer transport protein ExbD
MKFPRNARIFRGQLDAAPFASVFFLFVAFVMLGSMTYTPGVRVELLPANDTDDLTPVSRPAVAVAVDANGQFYYRNRLIRPADLRRELEMAVTNSPEPLTLVVLADRAARQESVDRLYEIARAARIRVAHQARLPRVFERAGSQDSNQ